MKGMIQPFMNHSYHLTNKSSFDPPYLPPNDVNIGIGKKSQPRKVQESPPYKAAPGKSLYKCQERKSSAFSTDRTRFTDR